MKNIGRRKLLIIILCIMLVSIITLSVAYAALSTSLSITGSTDVVASSWDVHFNNISFSSSLPGTSLDPVASTNDNEYKIVPLAWDIEGSLCSEGKDCISYFSETSFSFYTAPLSKPGDFKAIYFDVVNGGTIDAKLDSTILNGISSEQDVYLNYYVVDPEGVLIKEGDILSSGDTKTMILVLEFDNNVTADQLPTTNQSLNLSFTLNYVQK